MMFSSSFIAFVTNCCYNGVSKDFVNYCHNKQYIQVEIRLYYLNDEIIPQHSDDNFDKQVTA